ncbi:hypothetical protein GHT06_020481 [Daphnia sinensis]|uniref:Uncharacterized protein n=1 Tax=Daphnia sinensis TaxID=1820382 RepID=A0AAD5PQ01_9CRUS|nr:hypothetical protein GHT06_020481 [Daphnia sinensis]
MSSPSDCYGGQGLYSWDPRTVARVNRYLKNRNFDGRMEEWDRRPRGQYDEYEFAERDRASFLEQRGVGSSFYGQPHDHFEYRDRRPVEFSEPAEAEFSKRRPTDRSWLPKSSQKKKQKVKTKPEITEEISNWLAHGLSAEKSKAISKKFALDFEDKLFSIKPPKLESLTVVSTAEEALITTQLKIMDIAPPLINLYKRYVPSAKVKRKIRPKVRHRPYCNNVEELFTTYLNGEDVQAYIPGNEAVELLFTNAFLQSMLKEATQDVILANSSAAREKARAGISKTSRPDPSTRVGQKRVAPAKFWLRGGERYVAFSVSDSPKTGVNSRILDFTGNCSKVTVDVWVLG